MVAAASDSEPLQEAANRPAQNRYRNRGLSAAEIKADWGVYPEVGGGDGEEVGGDPGAAESAGIPEALAGACASEAVPHAPAPAPAVGGPAIPCCPSCDSSRCSMGLWMCQGALGLSVQLIDLLRFSRMSVMLVISPFE